MFYGNLFLSSPSLSEQLPENSMGKALRLLHERLSSKVSNGVHVETDGMVTSEVESNGVVSGALMENGLDSTGVGLGCDGLGLSAVSTVESNGILISSSI